VQKTSPLEARRPAVSELLTKCAIAAIDAARAAENCAAVHNFPLKFREDQIQAWTSTLYIQSSKQTNLSLMHRNETCAQILVKRRDQNRRYSPGYRRRDFGTSSRQFSLPT
jgi:hypothetical protein